MGLEPRADYNDPTYPQTQIPSSGPHVWTVVLAAPSSLRGRCGSEVACTCAALTPFTLNMRENSSCHMKVLHLATQTAPYTLQYCQATLTHPTDKMVNTTLVFARKRTGRGSGGHSRPDVTQDKQQTRV